MSRSVTKNGVSGYVTRIVCHPATEEYEKTWERVFGKEEEKKCTTRDK